MYKCPECGNDIKFKWYASNPYPLAVCSNCKTQFMLYLKEDRDEGWSIEIVKHMIAFTGSY